MTFLAITREVSSSFGNCELTYLDRVEIDVEMARRQHDCYVQTLEELGCQVMRLPEEPDLPDAVFVEDTALILEEIAILMRPGAESRRPEVASVAKALMEYRGLVQIEAPGSLDGGDTLRIAKDIYVGISQRSNKAGIEQLADLVSRFGYQVIPVPIHGCLHLKSAVTQVGPEAVLIQPEWVDKAVFKKYRQVKVDPGEPHAANALLIGDTLIYPEKYMQTIQRLEQCGLHLKTLDVSEIEKAEGAVTCCSLLCLV
jgi:dimethylargininase